MAGRLPWVRASVWAPRTSRLVPDGGVSVVVVVSVVVGCWLLVEVAAVVAPAVASAAWASGRGGTLACRCCGVRPGTPGWRTSMPLPSAALSARVVSAGLPQLVVPSPQGTGRWLLCARTRHSCCTVVAATLGPLSPEEAVPPVAEAVVLVRAVVVSPELCWSSGTLTKPPLPEGHAR